LLAHRLSTRLEECGRIFFQGYNQNAGLCVVFADNPRASPRKSSLMMETSIPQAPPVLHLADEDLSVVAQATPLAAWLERGGAPVALAAYRGAMTPRGLDAPEREIAALAFGAAVHDLGWMRRVAVGGADRFRWLSGMVTNAVNELAGNGGAWNFVLNAQGRIQGDLCVWREGDNLNLEIAADQHERLLAYLDRFIIMDDVELRPLSLDAAGRLSGETALGLAGPLAADLLARLGLPVPMEQMTSERSAWNGMDVRVVRSYGVLAPHYELWTQAAEISMLWQALAEAGATPVGADTLEAFRVAEGIPAYGIDIAERDLPQETSQMRALCFNKGCYVGQEVVERIRSRGGLRRRLLPLEVFGPQPTAGVVLTMEDGTEAGRITSAAVLPLPGTPAGICSSTERTPSGKRCFALGMMGGEAPLRQKPAAGDAADRNQLLNYTAGTATGQARILAAPPELKAS
jgi:folate-binding protein YgfZ